MTWSYSGNPYSSDLDKVRFEIGDTDADDPLLADEEITYAISIEGDVLRAAARCCEVLARKYARDADFRLGPQAVSASQRSGAYRSLAIQLRRRTEASSGPSMAEPSPAAFERRMMCNEEDSE